MRNLIRLQMALVFSLLVSSLATAQTASNVVCTGCVGTGDMANAAVTTGKIADGAVQTIDMADGIVTTQKIKDLTIGAIDLANGAVTTGKIRDGAVAFADLSPEVNDFLGGAIEQLTWVQTSISGVGTAAVECPSDKFIVSASCGCDDQNGTRNYGVLFHCKVAGTGAVAGCFPEAGTYTPFLPDPAASVTAVCLGATSANGTPWLPLSTGLTESTKSVSTLSTTSGAEAQWIAEQQAAYEAALIDLQKKYATHSGRILQRQR